ncbi:MAG TPA: ATP-binding protein [Clostridiaceae bacterium]|nr:ATP-binding protein [Clostridiaceae bacterium]
MLVKRDRYLQQLIDRKQNGMIKIISGIRRCGKSVLLFELFYDHLLELGVDSSHIFTIALDDRRNQDLRDPDALLNHVLKRIEDNDLYYIFLDEIQFVTEFEDVLNTLLRLRNVDIYVTGSNSKFLSSDIVTEFRGRGDQVHIYPLSYSEFLSGYSGPAENAWREYYTFGGMPQILRLKTEEQKKSYLQNLVDTVYLSDIIERHQIRHDAELRELVQILASGIGSLTNPYKLEKTFRSRKSIKLSYNTIVNYLDYLEDAFLIEKAMRFDLKGKHYINTPYKFYFTDLGLRNALLGFRQMEVNHIMENIIYNELKMRGYSVDVGVVEIHSKNSSGQSQLRQLEIDFVANLGDKRYYLQSAYRMDTDAKRNQEERSLLRIDDSFKKIIIVGDSIYPHYNEQGFFNIGIQDFLLDEQSMEK